MNAVDVAVLIEEKVNVMGNDENMKSIVGYLTNMHRTLIQSFIGKFIIPFIKKIALDYENGYYDARNEASAKMCKIMFDGLCKEYDAFKRENFSLPLI